MTGTNGNNDGDRESSLTQSPDPNELRTLHFLPAKQQGGWPATGSMTNSGQCPLMDLKVNIPRRCSQVHGLTRPELASASPAPVSDFWELLQVTPGAAALRPRTTSGERLPLPHRRFLTQASTCPPRAPSAARGPSASPVLVGPQPSAVPPDAALRGRRHLSTQLPVRRAHRAPARKEQERGDARRLSAPEEPAVHLRTMTGAWGQGPGHRSPLGPRAGGERGGVLSRGPVQRRGPP